MKLRGHAQGVAAVVTVFAACGCMAAPAMASIDDAQALQRAKALPAVVDQIKENPGAHFDTSMQGSRWRVQMWTKQGQLVAEIFIAPSDGKVLEKWTGYQAAWGMARGYPGAFGHEVTALWVWLPMLILFLLPFVPRSRPGLRHLDLIAVAALSVSFAGFNTGNIEFSTPTLYPPMIWLLGRMLARGLRGPGNTPPSKTLFGQRLMLIGVVFLIGFRIALVASDGNVIDVGEASVIGGDRLVSGKVVYGHFPSRISRGDTYGPVTWEAYGPFALIFDSSSNDGRLQAAGFAAAIFDLVALALLVLAGWRVRGPPLALLAAWFWVACPFTLYVSMCAANDGLVAAGTALALLSVTFAGARGGLARGAAGAIQGLIKMAGLALLPLLARVRGSSGPKALIAWLAGTAIASLVVTLPFLDDPIAIWRRTVGFQSGRDSPFTAWGLYHLPHWSQVAWRGFVVVLVIVTAVLPRAAGRTPTRIAALMAAVLIAVELSATYWFYTYIAWFLPAIALAVLPDWQVSGMEQREEPERSTQSALPAEA
jgi:hypothetical protein